METTTINIHQELIESCKAGDHQAFGKLYQLYAKAMYNVALRIIKAEEEAQDILQEAFIKAYSKINQFEYQANFGAWLKRIVINQALDCIRKKKEMISNDIDGIDIEEPEEIDWQEIDFTVEKVKKAIMMLPDGFRVVCSMYLFEGFEHKEIAQILGISESTSKSQFHRAKIKLKEILKQYENR
ncbi:RNA polymerase sigma factor [Marivirga sp. S37H4]|uniref:RNA polymerase sigma factor n=1 Tax=Marivirga aurantiaca TaxID=2802615 RepID=A0A934WZY8_9BACT|nr:RNA polymerase sigma factor [Marivirga aurantiaca]MBK6266333.1 RNA polymerase sigma factor [Marivirga aurantiaca]